MLKIRHRGWTMKISDNQAIATTQDGEYLEIRKTKDFRESLRLIKNAVDRRENTCKANQRGGD